MKKEITTAVVGECASADIINNLARCGCEIIVLPKFDRLPSPVSSHADMLLFPIDSRIFLSRDYYKICSGQISKLESKGYDIMLCDCDIHPSYPFDVPFNVAKIGRNIFANTKYISDDIKKYISDSDYSLHHVKQGYTKCSTAIITDNAIISADRSIAKKALELGIDVLIINNSPEAILLDGYNYGFLGGACGLCNSTLYCCGDISLHPDCLKISEFCASHDVSLCSLSRSPLQDIGGILFL